MQGPLAYRQALRVAHYRRAMAWNRTVSAAIYISGCGAIAALTITIVWALTLYWGIVL